MEGRVGVIFLSTDSQTFISRRRPLGGTTATSLRQVLPPDHSEPGKLSNSFTKECLIHTSLRYQILGTCYFCIFLPTNQGPGLEPLSFDDQSLGFACFLNLGHISCLLGASLTPPGSTLVLAPGAGWLLRHGLAFSWVFCEHSAANALPSFLISR